MNSSPRFRNDNEENPSTASCVPGSNKRDRNHPSARILTNSTLLTPANRDVANFYDRTEWLYPLADWFCAPGRRRLIRLVNRETPGHLLEIGVGPGRHLPLYEGHRVWAIDCSEKMVRRSRAHSRAADIRQMDGEQLDFADETFDYIVLCHVLSVTSNPARMLAEAFRVLRPDGRVFVLNHETPRNFWRRIEAMLVPLASRLRFRSWFRVVDISGVQRFQIEPLKAGGCFGLMKAYSLTK